MSTQSPNIPFDANEFDGKRVLVTGGTKGIGEAIVTRLLGGGATVLAAARTVPADGNSEHLIQADVSTRAGADHIISTTFDRLGGLDILINSAGGSSAPGGGVLALTDADWQQEFELNLFSAPVEVRAKIEEALKRSAELDARRARKYLTPCALGDHFWPIRRIPSNSGW
jgi:NAD(P)-dependent dehydrogenase (short-subunit alcohol dehydrogenase family)